MDGQTIVNVLVEIAELEELHVQARQTIERNTRQDRNLHDLQAEYEADAKQANKDAQQTSQDFRTRDREIRDIEARLVDRRDRLIGVSDRKQHRALTEEISSLEKRMDRLEEEAIACLYEEDSQAQAAEEARQESDDHGTETDATLHSMENESKELSTRIENIQLDLQRLISMLPVGEKRHLDRLRQKLDQSVVYQHNGACCGCFHQLPVQDAINVDRGRTVVRCPSCMRYIVHRSWK